MSRRSRRCCSESPTWTRCPRRLRPRASGSCAVLAEGLEAACRDIGDVRLALEGAFETAAAHAGTRRRGTRPGGGGRCRLLLRCRRRAPRWRRCLEPVARRAPPRSIGSTTSCRRPAISETRGAGDGVLSRWSSLRLQHRRTDCIFARWTRLEARLIPGTEADLTNPFFSPDGNRSGITSAAQLKRISISGGASSRHLCGTNPFGVSWGTDNTILFGPARGHHARVGERWHAGTGHSGERG